MKRPTLDDCIEYATERGYTFNPEEFWLFYEAKGWMVGKNPMKDWHKAMAYWEVRRKSAKPNSRVRIAGDPDFRGRF